MSIEETEKVDFIGINKMSGNIVLTISDHLDWLEDESHHILLLQKKVNSYLRFIESRELFEFVEEEPARGIEIRVMAKHQLTPGATEFVEWAKVEIQRAGFSLSIMHVDNT